MQWLAVILVLPYFIILLHIYRCLGKLKVFRPGRTSDEFISVIISCRNEQENLPLLLNDLSGQEYPQNLFEVIVIDDNSADRTFEIASDFTAIKNITVIKSKGKGKKEAISEGINSSSGTLIITTDADCRMGNMWLRTISSFFSSTLADMIVCPVKLGPGRGFFGKFSELEFLSLQGVTAGTILSERGTMCNGANLAFKKEAYLSNQENIHPEIPSGDDIFLLHSLKKNKESRIVWLEAMESVVTTASPGTAGRFLKQRKRWISKATAYDDPYTISLGIVTFVTILLQIFTLAAAFFSLKFLLIYLIVLTLKSVPDYLILNNTTGRYSKRELMVWFIPSQIVYPFYVLITFLYAFPARASRN
jgi:biofilm PGA synthesis N-glycosyltransferase PgaC